LIHSYEDFTNHPSLWDDLQALRSDGKVVKIGFSIYSPDELIGLLDRQIDFDIIQVPYSIFDRRFEDHFLGLKRAGVEVYVRSVFLQGAAFLGSGRLAGSLAKIEPSLARLHSIAEWSHLSISTLCLGFALTCSYVDHVVIGVDGFDQLQTNIESAGLCEQVATIRNDLNALSIGDENVLIPYKWENV
jgi:aryl-alcohol dehydrogenase-like predicted oxidoreductase